MATAKEELKRHRAESEDLNKEIGVLSQEVGDFFLRRLAERKKFDVKKSLFRLKGMRDEYDVLQKVEKQIESGVRLEELAEERQGLERTIDELEEEKRAEQKIIDEYLPTMTEVEKELTEDLGGIWMHRRLKDHVATIRNIDVAITQRGLEVSKIDDEIAELNREVSGLTQAGAKLEELAEQKEVLEGKSRP